MSAVCKFEEIHAQYDCDKMLVRDWYASDI